MNDRRCVQVLQGGEASYGYLCQYVTTAKACWRLPKHYRFVACEKDSASFQDTLPWLVKQYGKEVTITYFVVTGSEKVVEAGRVFFK